MTGSRLFLAACALIALLPLLPADVSDVSKSDTAAVARFPGWPTEFDGNKLEEMPLEKSERRFYSGFPGRAAKFRVGPGRTVVIRWVTEPTRRLHPASECYRGFGYDVTIMPPFRDNARGLWGCFRASRAAETLTVREQVRDAADTTWSDLSTWYWAAFRGKTHGPWWSVTVVERERTERPH